MLFRKQGIYLAGILLSGILWAACGGNPATPAATIGATEPEDDAVPGPAPESAPSPADVTEGVVAEAEAVDDPGAVILTLTSPAFGDGDPIPPLYSCDGDDISPALEWSEPPPGTVSFALILDDPDAPGGTWDHWLLFNLPAGARGLSEAVPATPDLPDGSRHGRNSWNRADYGGPCPPSGTHRYVFQLFALDEMLALGSDTTKAALLSAMEGSILAEATLIGTFTR